MATINTNAGAMVALQNLNSTNRDIEQVQSRINTGLAVASAKDNGGVYAIAQKMRADVKVTRLSAIRSTWPHQPSTLHWQRARQSLTFWSR